MTVRTGETVDDVLIDIEVSETSIIEYLRKVKSLCKRCNLILLRDSSDGENYRSKDLDHLPYITVPPSRESVNSVISMASQQNCSL